jgi:hypothetical protein
MYYLLRIRVRNRKTKSAVCLGHAPLLKSSHHAHFRTREIFSLLFVYSFLQNAFLFYSGRMPHDSRRIAIPESSEDYRKWEFTQKKLVQKRGGSRSDGRKCTELRKICEQTIPAYTQQLNTSCKAKPYNITLISVSP